MLKRISLGVRIGVGFGIVILMATFMGLIGLASVNRLNGYMSEYAQWIEVNRIMNERVYQNTLKLSNDITTCVNGPSATNVENMSKSFDEIQKGMAEWGKTIKGKDALLKVEEKARADLSELHGAIAAYRKAFEEFDTERFLELGKPMVVGVKDLFSLLETAKKDVIDPSKDAKLREAASEERKAFRLTVILTLIVLVGGILLAYFLNRGITKPIKIIIEDLSQSADEVTAAAGQVSISSHRVAEDSSSQAASLEETSSALEEIASMTEQNARSAMEANGLMKEANQVVGEANDSMLDLTRSMEEISKASEETSRIVKTIDEIAFQTNLLALNAAVEAARAGEAGAGFAVVADEVRNLAIRAANAARNTSQLIEGTVKKIATGSGIVAKSNETFDQVAGSTRKVGQLIDEISQGSREQAEGTGELNKAVSEMDRITQQTAANSEEAASASEELGAQARKMQDIVEGLVGLIGGKPR